MGSEHSFGTLPGEELYSLQRIELNREAEENHGRTKAGSF
jgi:hypothetical protein